MILRGLVLAAVLLLAAPAVWAAETRLPWIDNAMTETSQEVRGEMIPTSPPPAPTLALPASTTPSNRLTWIDNATNETSQEVWWKVIPTPPAPATTLDCVANPAPYTLLATLPASTTTFLHTGLTEGTSYCYEVRAVNSAGASPFSNQAGRTVPLTVPAADSGLTVTGGP